MIIFFYKIYFNDLHSVIMVEWGGGVTGDNEVKKMFVSVIMTLQLSGGRCRAG